MLHQFGIVASVIPNLLTENGPSVMERSVCGLLQQRKET